MVATVSYNPVATTVAQGMFNVTSVGLTQGTAYPDPAIRYKLAGGTLAQSETKPMWGGVGIFTDISGASGGPVGPLGTLVGRATSSANLNGFSVFDQNYAAINFPQSPVPQTGSGMQVNYYRLGSGARIVLACDPTLIALRGGLTTQQVAWDYVNQKLIAYAATTVSSGTYNAGTGLVTLTLAATENLNPGDTVTVSGATGTGAFASINGTFQAGAGTAGTTLTYTIATGLTLTITGGSVATGTALPVQILDVQPSNCQVVEFDPATGYTTWDFDGAAAVVLI